MPVSSSSMKDQIFFDFVLHRPGREDGDRREQGGQQDQKQADAVDTDDVVDAEIGHPSRLSTSCMSPLVPSNKAKIFTDQRKLSALANRRDGEERVRLSARHEDQQPRAEHRDRQQNTQMTDREAEHN